MRMKSVILSVLAAAVTAVPAVSAQAADPAFGGEYRLRGEFRDNNDFNDAAADKTGTYLQRIRFTAGISVKDDTTVKVTIQDSRIWGAEGNAVAGGPALTDSGTTINSNTDIHEGYVNISNLFGARVSLRAGRQELSYGDQRLVGSFGWNNNGRSFDALKFIYTSDLFNADLFTSKVRENTTSDEDLDFYGLHITTGIIPNNSLDIYTFFLRDGSDGGGTAPFGITGPAGNTTITGINAAQALWTVGARLKGSYGPVDYTAEVPFQTGSIDTTAARYDISAWAAAVKLGYTLPTSMKVRVGVEYDYASGDDNAGDNDIETFYNLFPTNHPLLGFMDMQGWRNVSAISVNASADITNKLKAYAAWWNFSLAEKQDAWYGAGNWNNTPTSGVRAANSNGEDSVGNEFDLVATYQYSSGVQLQAGYSHFFTGIFIDTAVADEADQDFAYLQLTVNF